ncbi:MAG: ATP-binding cassette domain-containing protein [Bacteroidetes bacterium]|nr:MAG: ATP-binding cassette domain-containing protein [Bacteroidota bacterium]
MNILEIQKVSKNYSGHIALSEVSLNIPEKSIFGLLGPNGAGKTSLIRIITQITAADSGQVYFGGELLQREHISQIGYLPEERGLYKKMQVGEQLMYLAQLKGMSATEAKQKLKLWFEKFEIVSWWKKNIEDLSKGMQQKVQFIATVLHQPRLIILDEPFSGFDPINANLIKDEILELKKQGSTIIFSTHRMESVEELCDYIALINQARKILDGKKNDIKNAYKDNIYLVETESELLGNDTFQVLKTESLDEVNKNTVKLIQGNSSHLIQEVLKQTAIISFKEYVPSINEIFISKVGKTE